MVDNPHRKIVQACISNDHQTFFNLVEENNTIGIDTWNDSLLYACINGNLEILKFIISQGACNFNNGLFWASCNGSVEICQLLIDKGADTYQCNFGFEGHPFGQQFSSKPKQNRILTSFMILEKSLHPILCENEIEIYTMLEMGASIHKFADIDLKQNIEKRIGLFHDEIRKANNILIPPLSDLVSRYSLY